MNTEDILMTNKLRITVRTDNYNIPGALESGIDVVWPNGRDRLTKGDIVYLIVCEGNDAGYFFGKFECEMSKSFDKPEDVPGYGDVWAPAVAEKWVNDNPNFMKLRLITRAHKIIDESGNSVYPGIKGTQHESGITGLSSNDAKELDKYCGEWTDDMADRAAADIFNRLSGK